VNRAVWPVVAAALAAATLAVLAVVVLTRPGARAKRAGGAAGDTAPAPTLSVETSRIGRILVDARGRTLYLFTNDADGQSRCTGGCPRVWPPALLTGPLRLGPGLRASKVTTLVRRDGGRQLVYNGHPLYSLTADTAPGQVSGQGFQGAWFVVSPSGRAIVPRGSKPPAGY
jgi:predicted lipoprotein with Yx(FWY)xxD motif